MTCATRSWGIGTGVFQSAVAKCVKDTVSVAVFPRIMNQINREYPWMDGYITQYVDRLNIRFSTWRRISAEKHLDGGKTLG